METVMILVFILFVFVCAKNYLFKNNASDAAAMPPSLHRMPLIGNTHLISSSEPHKVFHEISKRLGPVITFWFGKKPVIVVNEIKLAKDALLKQDKSFAGRPQRYTGGLYSRHFKGIIVADYGKRWKTAKTLANITLGKYVKESNKMEEIIIKECENLVSTLSLKSHSNEAVDISSNIKLTVMNVICALCFGRRYESRDPEFTRIVEANDWFIEGITCSSVVDAFPLLRYLPFEKMLLLRNFLKVRDEILEKKFDEHASNFDKNNLKDLVDHFINAVKSGDNEMSNLSRDDLIISISDLFIAGADSTTSTLLWTFLYLAAWPDKQFKLQEELDEVLGQRNPTCSDMEKMPYAEATISEVLRLSSLTPLSVPRKTTQMTELAGFLIPKDTTVIFNMFAMNHDDKTWPEPFSFQPERFIDASGAYCPLRNQFMPFSGGKRMCLGEKMAKMVLFLVISYTLKNYELSCSGSLELEGVNGITLKPKPFKVFLKNRF